MTVDSINFYVVNPLELTISKDKPIAISEVITTIKKKGKIQLNWSSQLFLSQQHNPAFTHKTVFKGKIKRKRQFLLSS